MQLPPTNALTHYADNTARLVPGYQDLQRMAALLLAERISDDARVLVLGAGGGLELKVFADTHPHWRFDGVDPSPEMLDLARHTLGPLASRVAFHEGYIDTAPDGPFDGATCLLTLHFLPREERLRTLVEVHRRLQPRTPFIVAHHSVPQAEGEKQLWLDRYGAFAAASGVPADKARHAALTIGERLPILSPEADEALLHEAGFCDVALFYAGFTFRGWVAYRS